MEIYIGSDPREQRAYRVCEKSLRQHASAPLSVRSLNLASLRNADVYTRPTETRDGVLWDVISDAPMATEFAISRFLVPHLVGYRGWALYCDCDFLFRADVAELFALAREEYAVMVVKHCYIPEGGTKMDGQPNNIYPRKNWSSLMLFNCGHWANAQLTPAVVNTQTGRDLHGFAWLRDGEIGALPFEWNWLELTPRAVHFTAGTPDMPGHEAAAYADEYRSYL